MKANVQYNDYNGTTAADRSDYLETDVVRVPEIIITKFGIPLDADCYDFVGMSVSGTEVKDVSASFFFKNKETKEVVKYIKSSIELQSILDLFKSFEFQIGNHLEDIDRYAIKEIQSNE